MVKVLCFTRGKEDYLHVTKIISTLANPAAGIVIIEIKYGKCCSFTVQEVNCVVLFLNIPLKPWK